MGSRVPMGQTPPRPAGPGLELSSGPALASRPADSVLTHLLEAPAQSPGSARPAPLLIAQAGALSNPPHYLLKIKKVELSSLGKS